MQILYTSAWTLVVNKPAGLQVERSRHGHPSVEAWANEYAAGQPGKNFVGIVHRLDRPVSGVLLLALRKQALKDLNRQFRERTVRKTYWALVEKAPPREADKLVHWLSRDAEQKKAVLSNQEFPGSSRCELDYRLLAATPAHCLLEVRLHTGRFHQIRAQLSAVGCPILGDKAYGSSLPYRPEAIALHARQLSFTDPYNTEEQSVTAPPPADERWAVILPVRK